MAIDYSWVAQPDADISGDLSNTFTNLTGFPWNDGTLQSQTMGGGTVVGDHTWGLPDMSGAPGPNDGWVLYVRGRAGSADVARWFDVTFTIQDDVGDVTSIGPVVWGQGVNQIRTYQFDLNDAAFAGANLADLRLRVDYERNGGNNSIIFYWVVLSKNPVAATSPASYGLLPVSVEHRAADLAALGGADEDDVTVWPDSTGKGQHMFLVGGAAATLRVDGGEAWVEDNGYGGFTSMGGRVLTPHESLGRLVRFFQYDIANAPGGSAGTMRGADGWFRTLAAGATSSATTRGDKHLLAMRPTRADILMHSDGSGGAHSEGTFTFLDETFYVHTTYVPGSEGDDGTPQPMAWVNDAAVGSPENVNSISGLINVVESYQFFNRLSDSRPMHGGISDIVLMDLDGGDAADVIDARDAYLGGSLVIAGAALSESFAEGTVAVEFTTSGASVSESFGAGSMQANPGELSGVAASESFAEGTLGFEGSLAGVSTSTSEAAGRLLWEPEGGQRYAVDVVTPQSPAGTGVIPVA